MQQHQIPGAAVAIVDHDQSCRKACPSCDTSRLRYVAFQIFPKECVAIYVCLRVVILISLKVSLRSLDFISLSRCWLEKNLEVMVLLFGLKIIKLKFMKKCLIFFAYSVIDIIALIRTLMAIRSTRIGYVIFLNILNC